jgi:hypothetical protein
LYLCEALLERLAQDLEHMTPELRQFIEEEHAIVSPRHLTRRWHLTPANQAHI